jgi:zinc D-Ala-D-Ala carboxypeptidase
MIAAMRSLAALLVIPLAGLACAARLADSGPYRKASAALGAAGLPEAERRAVEAAPARFLELLSAVENERRADPEAFVLVDKRHYLSADFAPRDLVALDGTGLSVTGPGHRLRRATLEALVAMSAAARADGVELVVGSAYRSYKYQVGLFARTVQQLGREKAESLSAHAGASQHQLGTALDFSPIDEAFASTKAGRWTAANAGRFGFSLSYPQGMSEITGYAWESWHFRYIGHEALALQNEYFGGLQEHLFLFLDKYRG